MGALVAGASIGAISGSSLEGIMSLGDPSSARMCKSCAIGAEAGAAVAVVGLTLGRMNGFIEGYADAGGQPKGKRVNSPALKGDL